MDEFQKSIITIPCNEVIQGDEDKKFEELAKFLNRNPSLCHEILVRLTTMHSDVMGSTMAEYRANIQGHRFMDCFQRWPSVVFLQLLHDERRISMPHSTKPKMEYFVKTGKCRPAVCRKTKITTLLILKALGHFKNLQDTKFDGNFETFFKALNDVYNWRREQRLGRKKRRAVIHELDDESGENNSNIEDDYVSKNTRENVKLCTALDYVFSTFEEVLKKDMELLKKNEILRKDRDNLLKEVKRYKKLAEINTRRHEEQSQQTTVCRNTLEKRTQSCDEVPTEISEISGRIKNLSRLVSRKKKSSSNDFQQLMEQEQCETKSENVQQSKLSGEATKSKETEERNQQETKVNALEKEKEDLIKHTLELQREKDQVDQRNISLTMENEELRRKYDKLNEQTSRELNFLVAQVEEKTETIRLDQKRYQDLQREYNEKCNRCQELESRLQRNQRRFETQLERISERNHTLTRDCEELRIKCNGMFNQIQTFIQRLRENESTLLRYQRESSTLNSRMARKCQTIVFLREELDIYQIESSNAQVLTPRRNSHIQNLRQELTRNGETIESLENQLYTLQNENERLSLRNVFLERRITELEIGDLENEEPAHVEAEHHQTPERPAEFQRHGDESEL